jgi:hypothetical protein
MRRSALLFDIAIKTCSARFKEQWNFIYRIQDYPISELVRISKTIKVDSRNIIYRDYTLANNSP